MNWNNWVSVYSMHKGHIGRLQVFQVSTFCLELHACRLEFLGFMVDCRPVQCVCEGCLRRK